MKRLPDRPAYPPSAVVRAGVARWCLLHGPAGCSARRNREMAACRTRLRQSSGPTSVPRFSRFKSGLLDRRCIGGDGVAGFRSYLLRGKRSEKPARQAAILIAFFMTGVHRSAMALVPRLRTAGPRPEDWSYRSNGSAGGGSGRPPRRLRKCLLTVWVGAI